METANPGLTPQLLQEIFLLKREAAFAKVAAVFEGSLKELCLRTRYPKEVTSFVAACLSQRGELETGAGERCLFIRDRETWLKVCADSTGRILIANPELDFESARAELLQPARAGSHRVIYSLANPRPDLPEIVDLADADRHEVEELLKKYKYSQIEASRLAKRSNGNVYLLYQFLSGTNERRKWAGKDVGFRLRCLALLGGWDDSSDADQTALTKLLGESYEGWVQRLYPLTREEEPPALLEGKLFRPVSRYETWQQLGHYLNDGDIARFRASAVAILSETDPALDLPKAERRLAGFKKPAPRVSTALRNGIAETVALLAGQSKSLGCSPALAGQTADQIVGEVLQDADWRRWASLSSNLPMLAEAAPATFLAAVEKALRNPTEGALKTLFDEHDNSDLVFGRNYHAGLLWALEVLAWNPDYLNRTCMSLARLAGYSLPKNMGNNPAATLRGIFLPWLPQTLATVEARRVAVEKVIEESPEVGWQLLLSILPETHQVGSYTQKPVWQDWIPSTWKEGVTRAEMYRQVKNYAELAVLSAKADFSKLTELIGRWNHLPREVFQNVLKLVSSEEIAQRPENERFQLWQQLTDEVERHRKYAEADWAMPEEELAVLESTANALRPTRPSVIYQRLFNHHDHTFFTSKDYEEERRKLAEVREKAVSAILQQEGTGRIFDMARVVKIPAQLGQALGRIGTAELDSLLLPRYLESEEPALLTFCRGYVWSRYHVAGFSWVQSLDLSLWSATQKGIFLAALPFHSVIWRQAETVLPNQVGEYWTRIWVNVYQAGDDLLEGTEQALANKRPDIAIQGIGALIHGRKPVSTAFVTAAVKMLIREAEMIRRVDHHELLQIVQHLQKAPDVDSNEMTWLEFQLLKLLDRFSGAHPVFLESRLATEPAFFHQTVTICFRSEREMDQPKEIAPEMQERAEHIFQLLHNWRTPPGTTKEGTLDAGALTQWIDQTRELCEASGHWAIAQQLIGYTLAHAPAGLSGLLKNPAVAKILDRDSFEDMRRGFHMELFNERGVHGFTHGRDELELAKKYREFASNFDMAGLSRIAATLRSLADSYARDAEREAKRDPFNAA